MKHRLSAFDLAPPDAQRGNALLGFLLVLGFSGLALVLAQPVLERARLATLRTALAGQISEVAQAAKTYYMFQVDAGEADCMAEREDCWPADLEEMIDADFLPEGADRGGFGLDIEVRPEDTLIIVSAAVPNIAQANLLAAAFGGIGAVDAAAPGGPRVDVSWSAPGVDGEHLALLDRDATRQMTGVLTFDFDTIEDRTSEPVVVDFGGGDIIGAGQVRAGSALVGDEGFQIELSEIGNLTAPSAVITTLAADDFRVNN